MGILSQPNADYIVVDGKITTQQQYTNSLLKRIKKLESLGEKVQKSTINKGVNIHIQLLVLKYSKMMDFFELDNIKKAKLFSLVTNRGTENIRRFLSHPQYKVSNKTKRKNLMHVIKFFESFENPRCQEAAALAKKDLTKLPEDQNK